MSSLILNPSNSGSGSVTLNIFGDDTEYNINLPKTNGTLVSSVNGKGADSNGNVAVTIPSIASNADAIDGTNNTKIMTPLRTKEAINKYGFAYKKLSSINSVAGSFWFDSNSGINDSELPPNVLNADWVGIQFGTDIGNEKQQIIFNATHRWYRYSDGNLGSENWSDWMSSIHLAATSAEAQAGTVTDKLMTPALVKSAVAKFNSASATKLQTKRNIDGVQFDGTANIHHFATCSTAAGTTEKVVPMSGFVLATGARIVVKFTVTNTVSAPTMNVNGTGAKPIKYHGGSFSASYLGANTVHEFVYDGANWCFVGDLDTKYTHPNSGVTAGTYNTVTVNAQGHVTGGNNVKYIKTVEGFTPDDAGNVKLNSHRLINVDLNTVTEAGIYDFAWTRLSAKDMGERFNSPSGNNGILRVTITESAIIQEYKGDDPNVKKNSFWRHKKLQNWGDPSLPAGVWSKWFVDTVVKSPDNFNPQYFDKNAKYFKATDDCIAYFVHVLDGLVVISVNGAYEFSLDYNNTIPIHLKKGDWLSWNLPNAISKCFFIKKEYCL